MRQAARELAHRLHLLRLKQRLLRPLQFELGLTPFRQVPRHLGEADQFAGVIANGVDHHARPEPSPVLAQPPAFREEPPFAAGCLQRPPGELHRDVLGRIEGGEVPSDDLLGRIALDPLGARIPVGHDPLGIERENGVVRHPLDQQPELTLAPEAGERSLPFLRHVSRDLGEPDDPAVFSNGIDDHHRPEPLATLAHPPSFGGETTRLGGELQGALRRVRLDVLLGVEAGKMTADDFAGGIALDPFGAGVPADDPPLWVEHDDRVVHDRLNQSLIGHWIESTPSLLQRRVTRIHQFHIVRPERNAEKGGEFH